MDYRQRTLISIYGDVQYARAYYHCSHCRNGDFPSDREMGLDKQKPTPATRQIISLGGMQFSFPDAKRILFKVSGINVSETLIRTITEAAGRRADALEDSGKLVDNSRTWDFSLDNQGKTVGYLSVDHTGVPQQGENAGKAPGRMAAVAMLYNPPADPQDHKPIKDRRYVSGLLDLPEVGERLREHAWQVGFDKVEQQVAITDAGSGLAGVVKKVFPEAEHIIDFWHAAEYFANVAKALHPDDAEAADAQRSRWKALLKRDGGVGLLASLEGVDLANGSSALREAHRDAVRYFRNHQEQMDYPRYLANGWRIGSGPVEAGCKNVVGSRLKGTGMRWKEPGTHEVCQLRAVFLSSGDLWERLWDPTLA